jgi:hypothetical protein
MSLDSFQYAVSLDLFRMAVPMELALYPFSAESKMLEQKTAERAACFGGL